jgi:hypothetical protein
MNKAEFLRLHAECLTAMRAYFVEADVTTRMLAKCIAEPLPFADRVSLLSQEVIENNAHETYLTTKRLLHDAARLGYGFSNRIQGDQCETET